MRNHSKICALLNKDARAGSVVAINAKDFLTSEQLVTAALSDVQLRLDPKPIAAAYNYVLKLAEERKAVYGLTTSFGGNIRHIIPPEEAEQLQENLILSHATNVGEYVPYQISKAAFLLRTLTLAKGYSGVSPDTLRLATRMIEIGLIPAVKAHGSVGASGDIAPLAALALAMIGKGKVWLPDGKTVLESADGLHRYRLEPVTLTYKEGLALLNGTSMMTAVASFALNYIKRVLDNSLVISAMSIEALRASKQPFDQRLHELKPHHYELNTARLMHNILAASKVARSHSELKFALEDELRHRTEAFYSKTDLQGGSYSLRAIPQVYHPILLTFATLQATVNTEINAIDDNPLVLPDQQAELHGANFHGYPIAVASDSMNLAMVGVSNMALARIDRLLKRHHSRLPWFLSTGKEGLFLGLHGAQFTAAGIGAELQNLSMPNSITQIPTNNDNQDFVSFGLQSTMKGLEMIILVAYVVAIEYMAAGQALWLTLKGKSEFGTIASTDLCPLTRSAYEQMLRFYTPQEGVDQTLSGPIEELADLVLLKDLMPKELSEDLWAA